MLASVQFRESALETLGIHLAKNYSAELLNSDDLVRLDLFGEFDPVWRIEVAGKEGLPRLLVGASPGFPASPPRVIVQPAQDYYLKLPHVESNGSVCVLPGHATADQVHIGEVMDEIIDRAIETIESGLEGKNHRDFFREIESYWEPDPNAAQVWLIAKPEPSSRCVYVVSLGAVLLVGDSEAQVVAWLKNFMGPLKRKPTIEKGIFLHIGAEILPAAFFRTNGNVIKFVEDHQPEQLQKLASLVTNKSRRIEVVVGLPTPTGLALLATSLQAPICTVNRRFKGHRPNFSPLNGFRDGRLPAGVLFCRLGKGLCKRRAVRRAWPEWIHSRGGGVGMQGLLNKSAIIIGAGSLGSEVAQMLCKAGVQRLKIIDPDILSLDNIGRHLLGAKEVGKNKAEALRDHLLGQFPHSEIVAIPGNWQCYVEEGNPADLFTTDLIIAMTGEWPSDCALNMEVRARGAPRTIFGWTEPHGHAGHALLVAPRGGCLICGRDTFGEVVHKVTEWPSPQLQAIPACGGFFQPYGATETGPIKAMIASLAIDCLIQKPKRSELRTWLGNKQRIDADGGTISQGWSDYFTDPAIIGQTVARAWPSYEGCPQCETK